MPGVATSMTLRHLPDVFDAQISLLPTGSVSVPQGLTARAIQNQVAAPELHLARLRRKRQGFLEKAISLASQG